MRRQGYQLTRWADDWVVTCRNRTEAEHALARAVKILRTARRSAQSGEDPDCAHCARLRVSWIQDPTGEGQVPPGPRSDQIQTELAENLYAIPTQKSVDRFKDQIRTLTQRKIPLRLGEVIETINPIIRGWGNYYCRSHVRKRFHQLDGWIIRRLWSHRTKRWRNAAWKEYPTKRLRTEFKLVSLVSLIPSLQIAKALS